MNRFHNFFFLSFCLFFVLSAACLGQQPSPLTNQERRDLDRLLPQTLRWLAKWNDRSFACPPGVQVNWFDDWKALQGKMVSLRILRGEKHLTVAIEPLHLSFTFIRLHDLGLGPAMPTQVCESTYAEHLEHQRQLDSGSPEGAKAIQEMRSNPRIGAALDALDQKVAPYRETVAPVEEKLEIEAPGVTPAPRSGERLTTQQEALSFNLGVTAARKDVRKMCRPGTRFKLTAPAIEVGDPFMYILVEELDRSEPCIEIVRIWRDLQGAYDAYSEKCVGYKDTVERYRKLVEQSHPKSMIVTCK